MYKVVQFGEGNFLRTFADVYFDHLNKHNNGQYEIHIVQPIPFGNLSYFALQNNRYHVVLRGNINGRDVEDVYEINSVKEVFSPFMDIDRYFALATDKDVKLIVSNTTEAGICFNKEDIMDDFAHITYPAKLTLFLYERFKARLDGVYILPVELIENNADELSRCVNEYIALWNLPKEFKEWNEKNNFYCNTLVDRVVSGYPKDINLRKHLWDLIGEEDELVSVGEPFGLWAIEKKGNIENFIIEGHHNIDVVLTDNIAYYKKRKVRILNGSHTNLVPICLWHGKETVFDCMTDPVTRKFIDDSLNEIIPYVSSDISATRQYADSVIERFLNPFINHQLTSIALNSVSKWRARDLPTFLDYYNNQKQLPNCLVIGFSYLVNQYMNIKKDGDSFFVDLPNRRIEVKDDLKCLTYFMDGHSLLDFMSDVSLWGMDLTTIESFYEQVSKNSEIIRRGGDLL